MPKLNYESIEKKSGATGTAPRVGYFALKNDKDEAIVRFMHHTPADFDIVAVHNATINGKSRRVNCIRTAQEPLENCPLCAADYRLYQRAYIHLIRYTKEADGTITANIQMWDRPVTFIPTLKNLCDEYGDLSKCIFKIKRNGVAGSTDTTYDIMYTNPAIYRDDVYKPMDNAFEGIEALGTVVTNRDFNSLKNIVEAETLQAQPSAIKNESITSVTNTPAQTVSSVDAFGAPSAINNTAPSVQPVYQNEPVIAAQPRTYVPTTATSTDSVVRPTRIYNPNNN